VANRRGKDYDPGMGAEPRAPTPRMTVEEFLAWAEGRRGRHELVRGEVLAQAAVRAAHWEVKLTTHVALLAAIKAKALPCHVVPDGATVRIDEATAYEPDAMVYCGPKPPPSAMLVENPVIIVEVLSPSTGRADRGRKLADYFRLPSVAHYLIIDPDEVPVIHHQRRGDDILTRILRDGAIALDPPGFEVKVIEIYGGGGYSPAST
jgi:Uma2 family endonuclease